MVNFIVLSAYGKRRAVFAFDNKKRRTQQQNNLN